MKDSKREILSALEERNFNASEGLVNILRLSTVCDPRFHFNYFQNKDEVKKLVLTHMVNVYKSELNLSNSGNSLNERIKKHGLEKLLDSDEDENDANEVKEKMEKDIPFPAKKSLM